MPELRQLRRRGHTISVMSGRTAAGLKLTGEDSGDRSSKDTGGLNPSYVFLQLYQCHPLIHSQDVPLRVPDNDVSNKVYLIL